MSGKSLIPSDKQRVLSANSSRTEKSSTPIMLNSKSLARENLADENQLAPKLSDDFYNDIEGFLGRSPPKIKVYGIQKQYEDKILLQSEEIQEKSYIRPIHNKPKHQTKNSNVQLAKLKTVNPPPPPIVADIKPSKQNMDFKLLEEALNYKISIDNESDVNMDLLNDDNRSLSRRNDDVINKSSKSMKMIPSPPSPSKQHLKKVYCSGLVTRIRSETNGHYKGSKNSNFNVSSAPVSIQTKKPPLDYDNLIANLEYGLSLQQLQKELLISQDALHKVTSKMEDIVRDTIEGGSKPKTKR